MHFGYEKQACVQLLHMEVHMEVVQTDKYIPLTKSTITQKQQIANLKSYVKANLDKQP